ncbi:MAG: maleylpyruvate isomerase family mycothiol-dependent enzyme [Kouleothrix sp.]|nr:maleylpyruvate isomerase family mycothiol-dependent enzyme [Kouleothrix sp.]
MVHQPQPIVVIDLFRPMLDALLDLLGELVEREWSTPVSTGGWTVKQLAQHLLGGDVGILSRQRDAYQPGETPIGGWEQLVALINTLNASWVAATQRLSPRLLRELLAFTGLQVCEYFETLDPAAHGVPVSWAGPEAAPVWLDLAREYTERWHHQQQIRDAVGSPGLKQPHFFAPALDTFVRALPHTYRAVEAPEGQCVALVITGDSGGRWLLRREQQHWRLYAGAHPAADAQVYLDQETAWRLFTKGITRNEAAARAQISGNRVLGGTVLELIAVIA